MKASVYFALVVLFILSCNSNADKDTATGTPKTDSSVTAKKDSMVAQPPATFFYNLKLTKASFDILDSYKGTQLVFQFYYNASTANPSPILAAFAMKAKHESINPADPNKFQKLLEYDTPSTVPLTGTDQYLGDLQGSTVEFKQLKKDCNVDPEKYDYFLFTPMYNATDKHISYVVSVVPTTKPIVFVKQNLSLNPSPPFSAQ